MQAVGYYIQYTFIYIGEIQGYLKTKKTIRNKLLLLIINL